MPGYFLLGQLSSGYDTLGQVRPVYVSSIQVLPVYDKLRNVSSGFLVRIY